jgi:hypothetical protein
VWKIYRWYKIMSPRIDMSVQSAGEDPNGMRFNVIQANHHL